MRRRRSQSVRRGVVAGSLLAGLLLLAALGQSGRAQDAAPLPDDNLIMILVRTTVVALNHANRTGNYTVFRDLGSPDFQQANSSARLAGIFAELRARDLDLGPVVLFDPMLTQPPAIDAQGALRVTGFFPTRPHQVHFEMAFQPLSGRWRLAAVTIDTRATPGVAPADESATVPTPKTKPEKAQ